MNPEIKQKWIAALRSGEYKQGIGALHYDGLFCCLGVLCDLHCKETNGEWKGEGKSQTYLNEQDILPSEVFHWAELGLKSPFVSTGQLAKLNDMGKTFETIADLIEKDL